MKKVRFQAVEVTWFDSATSGGWAKPEQHLDDEGTCEIRTVGMMVRRTKKSVTVSVAHSESGRILDPLSIPASCIKRVRRLS